MTEPNNIGEHLDEPGIRKVLALGEDRVEVRSAPLDVLCRDLNREGHVGLAMRDVEMLEEPDEVGVGAMVEDLKAGIDREGLPVALEVDRLRMPTEFARRLVDVDRVLGGEEPGATHTRDACPDDSNPHGCSFQAG